MIHIQPQEPGPQWNDWKKEAERETEELINHAKQDNKPKFKEKIWKKLKPFLEKLFHGKCAYCEGKYSAGSWLDVEHYRPKAKVTVYNEPVAHPGYYWLAYNWKNLLLACPKCNRGGGKTGEFPIDGNRAMKPGDSLEEEIPQLLNPIVDTHPEKHLIFGINGIIAGKTERGDATVSICNLNREELQAARQQEWEKLKIQLLLKLFQGGESKIISQDMQFSAYLGTAIKKFHARMGEQLQRRV